MENINENINRLRQIMSYDRSRSLLISESQYSIEDSVELEEQATEFDNAESIAKQIYKASKGLGTDENAFVSAVKDIKDKEEFEKVDTLLKSYDFGDETQGFQYYIDDELGAGDTDKVAVIERHLNSIGVKLESGSEGEEVSSDPFNIEKIKSGEQFLKKGQGNESSDTVIEVQELLITKMKVLGVSIDFEQSDLGNYGPKTAGLITAFQAINNLKADGIVGAKTLSALMA
tara:strand:+ start:1972 stop:2664 length:693 start_codon:yes stop_codon:yes gene_type:complete